MHHDASFGGPVAGAPAPAQPTGSPRLSAAQCRGAPPFGQTPPPQNVKRPLLGGAFLRLSHPFLSDFFRGRWDGKNRELDAVRQGRGDDDAGAFYARTKKSSAA